MYSKVIYLLCFEGLNMMRAKNEMENYEREGKSGGCDMDGCDLKRLTFVWQSSKIMSIDWFECIQWNKLGVTGARERGFSIIFVTFHPRSSEGLWYSIRRLLVTLSTMPLQIYIPCSSIAKSILFSLDGSSVLIREKSFIRKNIIFL